MRITALLLGLLLMGGFPVLLHAQQAEQRPASTGADAVTINWGAKAGFTAAWMARAPGLQIGPAGKAAHL